jgi:hypothetical protein
MKNIRIFRIYGQLHSTPENYIQFLSVGDTYYRKFIIHISCQIKK